MSAKLQKIVHLTTVHRPFDVRIFEKQCKSLAADGFEVVLVAVHERDETRDGVLIKALPSSRNRLTRMTLTTFQAFREARRQQGDVVHVHDIELLPWAIIMSLLGQIVVYDMHENVPKDILDKTWLPAWLKRPLAWVLRSGERIFLNRLPIVFAESSYAADYPWVRRSAIVLNMPRLESLPQPATERCQPPCITYIGGVAVDRGSEVTLQAIERLQIAGIDVGWECIGPVWPPSHLAELQQTVVERDLRSVHFRGYLPAPEGWEIVRRCQIGLAVLLPRPNLTESYPTKLFEYMALELPVIASTFPLYADVVDTHRCGICVNPDSALDLADAIQWLLQNPDEANEMGRRGRRAVLETYNWETEYRKLTSFYEQLV